MASWKNFTVYQYQYRIFDRGDVADRAESLPHKTHGSFEGVDKIMKCLFDLGAASIVTLIVKSLDL